MKLFGIQYTSYQYNILFTNEHIVSPTTQACIVFHQKLLYNWSLLKFKYFLIFISDIYFFEYMSGIIHTHYICWFIVICVCIIVLKFGHLFWFNIGFSSPCFFHLVLVDNRNLFFNMIILLLIKLLPLLH